MARKVYRVMADPLKASFDAIAQEYDAHRRQLIPCYDDFYRVTTDLATGGPPDLRVLDLGAGTGLMTWHILNKRPEAVCTLVDFADGMLNVAKKRFAGQSNVSYVTGDYRNVDLGSGYDVIVSSLSIHHLDDRDKARLYQRLYGLLKEGACLSTPTRCWVPRPLSRPITSDAGKVRSWKATSLR